MKKLTKRFLSFLLCLAVMLPCAVMCLGAGYNKTAALSYAAKNWNNGVGLCAEFVAACLRAGGLSVKSDSCTNLYKEISGVYGKPFVLTTSGNSIPYAGNESKVMAGDPIFYYCNSCKEWEHVVLCNGANDAGYLQDYAHNVAHNGKKQTYTYKCENCGANNWKFYAIHMVTESYFTVTFDANGGKCSTSSKKVYVGSNYETLPTPTRSNHTFLGWYTAKSAGTKITSSTPLTVLGNHTLYAHWRKNITYSLNDDGDAYEVTACNTAVTGSVKIASSYSGKPVTAIGDNAFAGCTKITSVTIPDSVYEIGNSAFLGCTSLKNVSVSEGTSSIGSKCFSGCTSLATVELPRSVGEIGSKAFENCNSKLTVNCDEASYAQTYAAKYKIATHIHLYEMKTVKEPDCLNTGLERYGCFGCNKVISESELPALGHQYKLGLCTRCGLWKYKDTVVKLVSATNEVDGVKVTFEKVAYSEGYYIYRKIGAEKSWARIATVNDGSLFYLDTAAPSGQTVKYTVRAYCKKQASSTYDKNGIAVLCLATPNVTVSNGSAGVSVKWNSVEGAEGYNIYRKSESNNKFELLTYQAGQNVCSYTDKTVESGEQYTYAVKAKNGKTLSKYQANVSLVYLSQPVLVSVKCSKKTVTLKFGEVTGAEGYRIYRKENGGGWKLIATVSGTENITYKDKNLIKGEYSYTARAYYGATYSYYDKKGLFITVK